MSKINLTEEELAKLLEAVNSEVEPPPELAGKLFPSLLEKLGQAGKFDFETLNRIRIPSIEYAGKRSEGVILASAVALGQSAPLQVVRRFGEPGEDGWQNLIVQGDNLQFLKTVYLNQDPLIKDKVKGKVKLIYIDPPFATKSDFQSKEGATSYSDKIESAEFLENLRERLIYLREIMAEDGCIYIHMDYKKGHYVKLLLDEIFGNDNFINEIIWRRRGGALNNFKCFGSITDTIYLVSKTGNYIFNPLKTKDTPEAQQYIKERFIYDSGDGRLYSRDPITNPSSTPSPSLIYKYKGYEPPRKGWAFSIETMQE